MQSGDEDQIMACVKDNTGQAELFDPDRLEAPYHSMTNTRSMYHQPAQPWTVVGA